jgi:hypothetical protein
MADALADPRLRNVEAPIVEIDTEAIDGKLTARYADMIGVVDKHWDAAPDRAAKYATTLPTDEEAGLLTELKDNQIGKLIKELETDHEFEKADALAAGRIVDRFFKDRIRELETIQAGVRSILKRYLDERDRKERARLAALAEVERKKAEALAEQAEERNRHALMTDAVAAEQRAEDLQAAATQAKSTVGPVRGMFGGRASLRTTYSFELEDITKVPAHYLLLNEQRVRADIRTAPKNKEGVPQLAISGIRIVADRSVV